MASKIFVVLIGLISILPNAAMARDIYSDDPKETNFIKYSERGDGLVDLKLCSIANPAQCQSALIAEGLTHEQVDLLKKKFGNGRFDTGIFQVGVLCALGGFVGAKTGGAIGLLASPVGSAAGATLGGVAGCVGAGGYLLHSVWSGNVKDKELSQGLSPRLTYYSGSIKSAIGSLRDEVTSIQTK